MQKPDATAPGLCAAIRPRSIVSVRARRILNSHVAYTNEFVVTLDDGSVGVGASPQGETVSIYEDKKTPVDGASIIEAVLADGVLHREISQEELDGYLQERVGRFGRNNCYALSLAFFNASVGTPGDGRLKRLVGERTPPKLCCNILNGGWHAYTNPVLSDFSEYLLVAQSANVEEVIASHRELQRVVRESLATQPKTVVSGNPVSRFDTADNRECIEFLLAVRDRLGFADRFSLMIDASAGDLWRDGAYRLAVTDDSAMSRGEFCDYWLDLVRTYGVGFLEDPLREEDAFGWSRLVASRTGCRIIGDNFYSSDAVRIEQGATAGCTDGVIIKPNQAGTVTAVIAALQTAKRMGQVVITSHRSISTESPFEATLSCLYGADYIKIGPLITDYSSVVRLNEIIRLTED